MALSLDSIYKPFNDFFTTRFATKEGETTQFRFARLPHTFVDSDFQTPMNPDAGPSAALAQQVFSEAVDGIATLDDDGRRVSMGTSAFSDLYHDQILLPSKPFIPPAVTDATQRQDYLDNFIQINADAKLRWENSKAASLEAGEIGNQYRPSTPSPATWWDKNAAVWTHQSFQITAAAPSTTQPTKPNDQLLRMKIDDAKFSSMLNARVAAKAPAPALSAKSGAMLRPAATMSRSPAMFASKMSNVAVADREVMVDEMPIKAKPSVSYKAQLATLPFKQRAAFQYEVAQDAPTQPVASTEVTISFDFCVVNVEREWLHDAFVNNRYWYIPGQGKGELSANNGRGAPAIPEGFVAIKNLRIKAPWTEQDISNLSNSVQFGPFNFSSNVVDGALCHDDIQIVAWKLRVLPDLPPNASA
jgi:hypothetical protein